jgi:hypothetical protein
LAKIDHIMSISPIPLAGSTPHLPTMTRSHFVREIDMGHISLAAGLAALVVFTVSAVNEEATEARPESQIDRVQDQMALALAHHERGNPNEARDALEAALLMDPDYAPALTLMDEYRYRGPQAK